MSKAKHKPTPTIFDAGYKAGRFCARYYPSARIGSPFLTSMADHREDCIEDLLSKWDIKNHAEFEEGFELGYEDEALDQAEAGRAGFEELIRAGSVAATARAN